MRMATFLAAMLLSLLFLTGLTGCNRNTDENGGDTTTTTTSTQATTTTTTTAAPTTTTMAPTTTGGGNMLDNVTGNITGTGNN